MMGAPKKHAHEITGSHHACFSGGWVPLLQGFGFAEGASTPFLSLSLCSCLLLNNGWISILKICVWRCAKLLTCMGRPLTLPYMLSVLWWWTVEEGEERNLGVQWVELKQRLLACSGYASFSALVSYPESNTVQESGWCSLRWAENKNPNQNNPQLLTKEWNTNESRWLTFSTS